MMRVAGLVLTRLLWCAWGCQLWLLHGLTTKRGTGNEPGSTRHVCHRREAWAERAEQRRQRAAWLAARNAYNPLRPRTGLHPLPPPLGLGPHGVVGGDYDRLPALGLNPQPLGLGGRLVGLGSMTGSVRLGGRAGSAAFGGVGRSWG